MKTDINIINEMERLYDKNILFKAILRLLKCLTYESLFNPLNCFHYAKFLIFFTIV